MCFASLVTFQSMRSTCARRSAGTEALNWNPAVFKQSPIRQLLAGYLAAAWARMFCVTGLMSTSAAPVGVCVVLLKPVVKLFRSAALSVTVEKLLPGDLAMNLTCPCPKLGKGTVLLTVT